MLYVSNFVFLSHSISRRREFDSPIYVQGQMHKCSRNIGHAGQEPDEDTAPSPSSADSFSFPGTNGVVSSTFFLTNLLVSIWKTE